VKALAKLRWMAATWLSTGQLPPRFFSAFRISNGLHSINAGGLADPVPAPFNQINDFILFSCIEPSDFCVKDHKYEISTYKLAYHRPVDVSTGMGRFATEPTGIYHIKEQSINECITAILKRNSFPAAQKVSNYQWAQNGLC
jgi:hypothetical protein